MNEQNYTSLGLSQKLAEAGCELESKLHWFVPCFENHYFLDQAYVAEEEDDDHHEKRDKAYDILNDICCRYAPQFFGEGFTEKEIKGVKVKPLTYNLVAIRVLSLLQRNKKQEAEDYIWSNCLFNPKNQ